MSRYIRDMVNLKDYNNLFDLTPWRTLQDNIQVIIGFSHPH
jgi:hypothetical protein